MLQRSQMWKLHIVERCGNILEIFCFTENPQNVSRTL